MQFQKKEKRQTTVRFDSHHVRLRTGEVQRKTGSYMYRWTDKLGKRNTIWPAYGNRWPISSFTARETPPL